MKQIFKKIGVFTLSILLGIIFISTTLGKTNAYSQRVVQVDDPVVRDIYGNVKISSQHIDTINNGLDDVNDRNYGWNNHTVHWADFDPSTGVKIVTYSSNNKDKWKMTKTKDAAKQWEAENPGWIVLAGINGDFFDINGTGQPTGNFMQSGDMYKADLAGGTHLTVGWKSDGTPITGQPTLSSNMFVKVIDEKNNVLKETVIAKRNSAPAESGITLLTKDVSSAYDLTGYTVYDCEYEICRVSNAGYPFVKGTVKEVVTLSGEQKPETGHFYLVSKDGSLDQAVKVGDSIKCEYSFTGEWSDVQNTIGSNYKILENGEPIKALAGVTGVDNLFISTTHPRTLIGIRADGSTVFMTIEGRGTIAERRVGASLYECAEMLQALGCVEGYNLDGGGSTTLIAKNIIGSFDVINQPSDGSERSDGNHCFVVMRDPGFNVTTNISYDQVGLDLLAYNDQAYGDLSDIAITVNGVTQNYNGQELLFKGLEQNTDYEIKVTYTATDAYDDSKRSSYTYKKTFTTVDGPDYIAPTIELFEESVKTKTMLGLKYKYLDPDSMVENAYIVYGEEKVQLTSKTGTSMINNLDFENNSYEFKLVLEYTNYLGKKTLVESDVLSYVLEEVPHEHQFVDGVCSCGQKDPNYKAPEGNKKKCGKKSAELIIATISLSSALALLLRKRK